MKTIFKTLALAFALTLTTAAFARPPVALPGGFQWDGAPHVETVPAAGVLAKLGAGNSASIPVDVNAGTFGLAVVYAPGITVTLDSATSIGKQLIDSTIVILVCDFAEATTIGINVTVLDSTTTDSLAYCYGPVIPLPAVPMTVNQLYSVGSGAFSLATFPKTPKIWAEYQDLKGNTKKVNFKILYPVHKTKNPDPAVVTASLTGKVKLYSKAITGLDVNKDYYKKGLTIATALDTVSPAITMPLFGEVKISKKEVYPGTFAGGIEYVNPEIALWADSFAVDYIYVDSVYGAIVTDSTVTDSNIVPCLAGDNTITLPIMYSGMKFNKNKKGTATIKAWIETKVETNKGPQIKKLAAKVDKKNAVADEADDLYVVSFSAKALAKKIEGDGYMTYLIIDNGIGYTAFELWVTPTIGE